jgi:hypothetical protein
VTDVFRRSVAGHVGRAVLAGGLAGAAIAASGALPALVLQRVRTGLSSPEAWWGMPATLGMLGGALGVAAGILFGLCTLGLRGGTDRRTRRSVAAVVAVSFGVIGGGLLSLIWTGAADGGGIVLVPGAILFCAAMAYGAADAILVRLLRSPAPCGRDANR